MAMHPPTIGLKLMAIALLVCLAFCSAHHPDSKHHHVHHLAGRDDIMLVPTPTLPLQALQAKDITTVMPCSTPSGCISVPAPSEPCSGINGWPYTESPGGNNWTLNCDIDYPGQNIFPFTTVSDFLTCLLQCDNHNQLGLQPSCAGFVFAPERVNDADDCYLKYSLNSPGPATIHLIGATSIGTQPITYPTATTQPTTGSESLSSQTNAQFKTPQLSDIKLLGASTNKPTTQYLKHQMAQPIDLASNLLTPGVNLDLIVNYPIAADTGSWTSVIAGDMPLEDLSDTPLLSRDGGKGGTINNSQLFIFCDTATYQSGNMVSFVSSSVATDSGMNALDGNSLTLVDQIGEWQDDAGRMRGLAPMTTGEESFNIAVSGEGYRYAIWPESSLIPLNNTNGLLYASLVYDTVNMTTQNANFTTIGNTLLLVSVDEKYGPGAQRIAKQLFQQNEVPWGSLGGFRSWGSSGVGGNDGKVYVFGQVNSGVLIARTTPDGIADRSTYTYWDGKQWSNGMLPTDSTSYMLDTAAMDLDIIYSPYHGTFIAVYLTPMADNTFYFRYLKSDSPITPPYAGGSGDYAESLVKNSWSSEQKLYTANTPCQLYIYAGGVHAGYFGNDDITNGGTKMLISWTQHTCQDASSEASGYSHMTAVITFK